MSDALVLCYHAVSEHWSADLSVRSGRLSNQLELLARLGYRGVTFSEIVAGSGPGKRVAVTFDDGFHSVIDQAFPILANLGWPATIFVVTDYGDGDRPLRWPGIDVWFGTVYEPELAATSWEELRTLKAAGWEVGSHTCSHPRLTQLGDEELRHELADSRALCEQHLGVPCRSIAYPYGDVNGGVIERAKEAGYLAGASLPAPLHPVRPLDWPRVGVYHHDQLPRFMLKASSLGRRVRTRKVRSGYESSDRPLLTG